MAVRVTLEDVNGSFARFVREAPKVLKKHAFAAAEQTRQVVARRIYEKAPVGPNAPHMRDAIEVRGTYIGIFDPEQAAVALYNEYRPNQQPFMADSARDEDAGFRAREEKAIKQTEHELSI